MKHLEIIGFSPEDTRKLEQAIAEEVLKDYPEPEQCKQAKSEESTSPVPAGYKEKFNSIREEFKRQNIANGKSDRLTKSQETFLSGYGLGLLWWDSEDLKNNGMGL